VSKGVGIRDWTELTRATALAVDGNAAATSGGSRSRGHRRGAGGGAGGDGRGRGDGGGRRADGRGRGDTLGDSARAGAERGRAELGRTAGVACEAGSDLVCGRLGVAVAVKERAGGGGPEPRLVVTVAEERMSDDESNVKAGRRHTSS
jgi:hypothetical protein